MASIETKLRAAAPYEPTKMDFVSQRQVYVPSSTDNLFSDVFGEASKIRIDGDIAQPSKLWIIGGILVGIISAVLFNNLLLPAIRNNFIWASGYTNNQLFMYSGIIGSIIGGSLIMQYSAMGGSIVMVTGSLVAALLANLVL